MKKNIFISFSVLFLVLFIFSPVTHSQQMLYYSPSYSILSYYYLPVWLFPPVRTSQVVTSVNPTLALLLSTLTPAPAPAVVPTITITIPVPPPVPTIGVLTALQTLGGGGGINTLLLNLL